MALHFLCSHTQNLARLVWALRLNEPGASGIGLGPAAGAGVALSGKALMVELSDEY